MLKEFMADKPFDFYVQSEIKVEIDSKPQKAMVGIYGYLNTVNNVPRTICPSKIKVIRSTAPISIASKNVDTLFNLNKTFFEAIVSNELSSLIYLCASKKINVSLRQNQKIN